MDLLSNELRKGDFLVGVLKTIFNVEVTMQDENEVKRQSTVPAVSLDISDCTQEAEMQSLLHGLVRVPPFLVSSTSGSFAATPFSPKPPRYIFVPT